MSQTRDISWHLPDGTTVYGAQRQLQAEELPPGCYFVLVRGFSSLVLVYDPNAPWVLADPNGVDVGRGGFVGWIEIMSIPPQNPSHMPRGGGAMKTFYYADARDFSERTGLGLHWPGKKET